MGGKRHTRTFTTVSNARAQLSLTNSGKVIYLGGTQDRLEERVRGMRVHHIDGEYRLHPQVRQFILHPSVREDTNA